MSLRRELKRELEDLFEKIGLPNAEVEIATTSDTKKVEVTVLAKWTGEKSPRAEDGSAQESEAEDVPAGEAEDETAGLRHRDAYRAPVEPGRPGRVSWEYYYHGNDASPEAQVSGVYPSLLGVAGRELETDRRTELLDEILNELKEIRQAICF